MRPFLALALFCLICSLSTSALAGSVSFSNLRFVADSSGGSGVFARVTYLCYDSAWDGRTFVLTRTGNTLTVTIPNSGIVVCFSAGLPPEDFEIPLGTLPAGDYQFVMQEAPATSGGDPVPLVAGPFTVLASGAAPYSNLRVLPNPGQSASLIQARVLFTCNNGSVFNPPVITRIGQTVHYRQQIELDPCFGGVPPPPQDMDLPIGQFTPGQYTLVVLQEPPSANTVIPALSTPFAVLGSAQSVPADSPWSMLLMSMIVLVSGLFWHQRNQSR